MTPDRFTGEPPTHTVECMNCGEQIIAEEEHDACPVCEAYLCPDCGEYRGDWNYDHDCCEDCWQEREISRCEALADSIGDR